MALDDGGNSVNLAGIIDSSNSGGLTKLGAGTLVLSGAIASGGAILAAPGHYLSGFPYMGSTDIDRASATRCTKSV